MILYLQRGKCVCLLRAMACVCMWAMRIASSPTPKRILNWSVFTHGTEHQVVVCFNKPFTIVCVARWPEMVCTTQRGRYTERNASFSRRGMYGSEFRAQTHGRVCMCLAGGEKKSVQTINFGR